MFVPVTTFWSKADNARLARHSHSLQHLIYVKRLILTRRPMILHHIMATLSPSARSGWVFDVGALMVLLGEGEEIKNRLSQRSLPEALAAAPVSGIQCYLREYNETLQQQSDLSYFSPFGCKSAPLRNMTLDNAIRQEHLLADGRYSVFQILHPSTSNVGTRSFLWSRLWLSCTWILFGGLVTFCLVSHQTTWIGTLDCLVFTLWSIVLRLLDCYIVRPVIFLDSSVSRPNDRDSVFILGRSNSVIVLEGSRKDIKAWTGAGLVCKSPAAMTFCGVRIHLNGLIRFMTLLVLVLIFSTVPNGSTMDQLSFVLLNVFGQVNTLLRNLLSAKRCMERLKRCPISREDIVSRTQIYAELIKYFKGEGDPNWVEKAGLLPNTEVWMDWKRRVVENVNSDPKELYNQALARP